MIRLRHRLLGRGHTRPAADASRPEADETDSYACLGCQALSDRVAPLLTPIELTNGEFRDLVAFVRDGLHDPKATQKSLCRLIPKSVPSGQPMLFFEGC